MVPVPEPSRCDALTPVFGPQDFQSEARALLKAQALATEHSGVIAWSREGRPDIGEYGEPTTLFTASDVPDME